MKIQSRSELTAILAASLGNVFWGFSFLLIRIAYRVSDPSHLLSIRFVFAFILLNIILLVRKEKLHFRGRRYLPLLCGLMTLELTGYYFESYGIVFTNSTFAGISLSVVPVIALLFGVIFLREFPTRRQILFSFLPIAGVILITISGHEIGIVRAVGVLCLLGAILSYAGYRTINRIISQEFTSMERTYAVLGCCAVVCTIAALVQDGWNLKLYFAPLAEPEFLYPMLILSVFCSIGSNLLVNFAATQLSVLKLSIIGTICSLCSMFAGVVFLHEPMTGMMGFGAIITLIGIWQVTAPQKQASEKSKE